MRIKRTLLLDNVTSDANSTGDFRRLNLGRNVYIGDGVYFDLADAIRVDSDAVVAGQVRFVTHLDVGRAPWLATRLPRMTAPVYVESGASVSFGATLLAGSVVAKESVLAAGAVLLQGQRTEPRTVWAGVPARQVARL